MGPLSARFFAYMVIAIGVSVVVGVIMAVPMLHAAQIFLLPAMLLIAWVAGPVLTHYFAPIETRSADRLRKR